MLGSIGDSVSFLFLIQIMTEKFSKTKSKTVFFIFFCRRFDFGAAVLSPSALAAPKRKIYGLGTKKPLRFVMHET